MKRLIIIVLLAVTGLPAFRLSAQETPRDLSPYILTPPAPETPRINGPKIYGARPGADFLFRIPVTGLRPMTFEAKGLPKGLKLDRKTGIITGKARKRGTYEVSLKVSNEKGSAERSLRIVIGDHIALTPPLGWNSYNCWGITVSQEKVLSSAKALLEKGLADYGWTYINIDDGWQGIRGGKYNAIQPNRKFTDMKALADFLHENGLKLGIYSGPWIGTFGGHIGSSCENRDGTYSWVEEGAVNDIYKIDKNKIPNSTIWRFGEFSFAAADARQWADWGVDYLKYDWKHNDPWWLKDMRTALLSTGRDIVYSISCRGKLVMGPYFKEYAECWRTTGDIKDTWESIKGIGFDSMERWAGYKSPGNWPDADMLVLGTVGWGTNMHQSNLTPDEQYTHMTLWSILASPLLIGCDLAELDDFTLNLLCNSEVLDVNQDPLGFQGTRQEGNDTYAVYLKPLEDGSVAVALFNLTEEPRKLGFTPNSFGLIGPQTVRDLWRQEDLKTLEQTERLETMVPPHGVRFLKLSGNTGEKLRGKYQF